MITLLAFIVILLVGLASYTRIETAVAGNTQRQEQARQNALLGLNVALAQLQKAAGPDRRVTATAEAVPNAQAQKLHYTGVWNNEQPADPPVWLVSGLEAGATEDIAAAIPVAQRIELIGTKTAGTSNSVVATVQDIRAVGVPGTAASATTTIGRYAWWVGDQGVKAPVAVPDTSATVNYAPFGDSTAQNELGKRLRQQLTLGAGAADATGTPVFEPQDKNNATLVASDKIMASGQLAFLKTPVNAAVGLKPVQDHFHAWSPNNFAVLANTKTGGLRQDLSLKPDLLGDAFAAWADYSSYLEDPATAGDSSFPPMPPLTASSLRRRYKMRSGSNFTVAPTLNYFLLSFNLRTQGGSSAVRPIEARAFWKLALWNPYTAALVPEQELRLEISGLPDVQVANGLFVGPGINVSLQTLFGGGPTTPIKIKLPWTMATTGTATDDRTSWLPGRVYNWRSIENTASGISSGGFDSRFYSKSYTAAGESNAGVIRTVGPAAVDGDIPCFIVGGASTITAKLFAVRPDGDVELGTFVSPPFSAFTTPPRPISQSSTQFVFFFRSPENAEKPDWLKLPGADPHQAQVVEAGFVYGPNGESPGAYGEDYEDSTFPDRLLDRATNSRSYNEDVPVFELPRAPVLSLGMLQHFPISGQPAFSVGNSWGSDASINALSTAELFDRFYFSGLSAGVAPLVNADGSWKLPSPALTLLPRNPSTGAHVTVDDFRAAPTAHSSRFLLSTGAFNLNSTNTTAWVAMLRGIRFPNDAFDYLDSDFDTGTRGDLTTTLPAPSEAHFFRFSQSAQETYKADVGYAASTKAPAEGAADPVSNANTHLFRRGVKVLSADQTADLAGKIVAAIKLRQATSGPFRSMEDWIRPSTPGGPSLLEQAVADTTINKDVSGDPIEFSSQFLTQGDIMTALAPVLFPRSDTFVIRAYGEAVNPATNATEGRAWCEATVQRVPEYFDSAADAADVAPADLTSDLNKTYGRRFKIVSFRWLTRSDI